MAEFFIYLATVASLAPGHTVPDGVIFRAVQVVVRSSAIEVRYQLGLSDNMIRQELRALSAADAEIPADAAEVIARYRDVITPLIPKRILVTIDGQPVALRVHRADIVRQPHRQLELVYLIPFTPGSTPAKFILRDDNFPAVPGYHFAAMRARGDAAVLPIGGELPLDRLPSAPEPGEAVSVPLEPMRGLAAYVCTAGASPPITLAPASPPGSDSGSGEQPTAVEADVSAANASGMTSPTPADVAAVQPEPPAKPPATQQAAWPLAWFLGWGVAAFLIAAWWWTSHLKPN